jgi:hypothetical protein
MSVGASARHEKFAQRRYSPGSDSVAVGHGYDMFIHQPYAFPAIGFKAQSQFVGIQAASPHNLTE